MCPAALIREGAWDEIAGRVRAAVDPHGARFVVKRVLVVGEPLVELLEEPAGTIRRGFGGDALNLAVYLARESPELHVMLASAAR